MCEQNNSTNQLLTECSTLLMPRLPQPWMGVVARGPPQVPLSLLRHHPSCLHCPSRWHHPRCRLLQEQEQWLRQLPMQLRARMVAVTDWVAGPRRSRLPMLNVRAGPLQAARLSEGMGAR